MSGTYRDFGHLLAIAAIAAISMSGQSFAQGESQPPARSPRLVAPELIAPPERAPTDLQRIEPRPPLGGSLEVLPGYKAPATAKPQPPLGRKLLKADPLLFKPVAEQAGVITAEGRTITLAGIEPVAIDETCGADAGSPWPCGMIARTSFRNFLRGRAVRCDFPDGDVPQEVTVACRMGNRDLAEWLVVNGWARASDDTYKDMAKAAEDARRGVFGDAPRGLAASLRAAPSAPSGLTALPSGGLSILPSGVDQPTVETPQAATPPVVTPQPDPAAAPAIQSAPLPPPSKPLAE